MLTKTLDPVAGRTFVCGDIHGCYDVVENFLTEIKFNKSIDRLIGAGDLVDRGPHNEKCLNYLYKPWFKMVKGNHDWMMHDTLSETNELPNYVWLNNGGRWAASYLNEQSEMAKFVKGSLQLINNLPLLITVNTKSGKKFHVIHAELYWDSKEPLTDSLLADENVFRSIAAKQSEDGDCVMWGRRSFGRFYNSTLHERDINKFRKSLTLENKFMTYMYGEELSHIYSGHTIVRKPIQFMGQTLLDTMAYNSYESANRYGKIEYNGWSGLTITEPETGKFWLATDRFVKEASSIII